MGITPLDIHGHECNFHAPYTHITPLKTQNLFKNGQRNHIVSDLKLYCVEKHKKKFLNGRLDYPIDYPMDFKG